MIKKNGNGKHEMDWGSVINLVIILATILIALNSQLGDVEKLLENHDVRIGKNEESIVLNYKGVRKISSELHAHELKGK